MMQKEILSRKIEFDWFTTKDLEFDYIPWKAGEQSFQNFLKLSRGGEVAFLYTGTGEAFDIQIQEAIASLVNEGWMVEGNINLYFDGTFEPDISISLPEDTISLELGANLLPLVDPKNNAPILNKVDEVRYELGREMGVVPPTINLKDNLNLSAQQYVIKIKGVPYLKGEIFLDRYLILGSLDKIGKFKGWSITDPVFKAPGKWIEATDLKIAEGENLMIFGPLNILTTHLKFMLRSNLSQILGLQETYFLLRRLSQRCPKVTEEFLGDNYKLRKVRLVLHNLLNESVPITDIVTILETVGDNFDKLEKIDLLTEFVRMKLSRQICQSLLNAEENILQVFCLSRELEQELSEEVQKNKSLLLMKVERVDRLLSSIKKIFSEYPKVSVLLAQPPFRLPLSRLLAKAFPYISIISTTEILPDIKIQIVAEVEEKERAVKKESVKEQADKRKSIWTRRGSK